MVLNFVYTWGTLYWMCKLLNTFLMISIYFDYSLSKLESRLYMQVFFFGGRMICGPDPRGFILTVISIIICEWIFFSYRSDVSPKILAVVSIISVTLSIIVRKKMFKSKQISACFHLSFLDYFL